ncbi:MAG: MMPL family transporter [Bauldia sp.]|nr:MMPL family transporter [Bauldia sp.]
MFAALSPASLARRSARHPWLTIGAWVVALGIAGAAAALWLGDALTTANGFTTTPEAAQAQDLINERFFPPGPRDTTEIVYIHSDTLTVDDPAFAAFAGRVFDAVSALGPEVIRNGVSWFRMPLPNLVTLDRRSTGLVFTLVDDFPSRASRMTYLDALREVVDPAFELHALMTPGTRSTEMVIVQSAVHPVDSPEFRSFTEDAFLRLVQLGPSAVAGATTYYATGEASLVSADGTATLIPVILGSRAELPAVLDLVHEMDGAADFEVAITGAATVDHDFNEISERDLRQGEFQFGLPAAIVVLVLVLGAVVAALVPLVVAAVSIAVALGLAAAVGTVTDLSLFLVNMVFMMGLAVGIDYCLFVIARYREERANGLSVEEAIARTGGTASRAVLFSGVTVVLALVGLLFVPTTIFFSLGLGAILVVLVAIAGSLTLLPAILRLLGDRIEGLRVPFVSRASRQTAHGGVWEAIARMVMRAPVVSLVLAAGALLALASPALDLRTGGSGVSAFPDSFESKRGFEILQEKFSTGIVAPTNVVIDGDADDPAIRAAADDLRARITADAAFGPIVEQVSADGRTIWLRMPVTNGDSVSDEAVDAVKRVRNDYIPAAFAGVPARVLVGGETAANIDWFAVADAAAPIVYPFVLVLSFLLLLVVFRSIVVPVNAILMNLLSVGAAYGLLVLVFQKGFAADFFGFSQVDTIEAWIPIFLFSVLFGLSMDYHVFLLSRIREHFGETRDNEASIVFGVRSTARLITGAALIMVAVFGGFASGDLVMFQQVGFGLGVAVLLDATIVRSVLVPATMRLIGRWNWYLPPFLRWLPHLAVEGHDQPAPRAAE